MTFFDDVEFWNGRRVPFYKRAQLTVADLALAFDYQGWGGLHDLGELTIFADNLVPHVLRNDGVLLYDTDLARIDREELIPAGSKEEIEIRACALHSSVELIVHEIRQMRQVIKPMDIDFLLWNRGQGFLYKSNKPRHRTRTVFY